MGKTGYNVKDVVDLDFNTVIRQLAPEIQQSLFSMGDVAITTLIATLDFAAATEYAKLLENATKSIQLKAVETVVSATLAPVEVAISSIKKFRQIIADFMGKFSAIPTLYQTLQVLLKKFDKDLATAEAIIERFSRIKDASAYVSVADTQIRDFVNGTLGFKKFLQDLQKAKERGGI